MSDNQPFNQYEDDTISLVDLVAVVVRHRLLIVLGTALVAVISVVAVLMLPQWGFEVGAKDVYTAERKLVVEEIPSDLRSYLSVNVVANIQSILRDPRIVGEVYRAFEEEPPAERTEAQYTAMIRRDVIGKNLAIGWDGSIGVMTVSYTAGEGDKATAFLDALIERLGPELAATLGDQFIEAEELLGEALEKAQTELATVVVDTVQRTGSMPEKPAIEDILVYLDRSGSETIFAFRDTILSVEKLQRLSRNAQALYTVSGAPIVYADTEGSGKKMIVIISTITAFFLTVFLAFVLEYVRRVREDKEEMEKLRVAWRRG